MDFVKTALVKAVKQVFDVQLEVEVSRPDPQFGDFSSNLAMQLAPMLNKSPRDIAEKLVQYLESEKPDWLARVEIAGPGFINIFISDKYLFNTFSNKPIQVYKGQHIIAEYSDPNAFKALHAGHLYTTLVGNAVANILEASGAKVMRLNYGGDVGLHAAKAMWGILRSLGGENPEKLDDITIPERPTWVGKCYVDGNTAYESDEKAKQEIIDINKKIYQLHENDDTKSDFAQIYWTCRQWSYDGFKKLYETLGVHAFDEYIPESLVTPLGIKTVSEGEASGVFEKSEGAVIYSKDKSNLHTRVFITKEGLPTYEAKELGLAVYKWQKYKFDQSFVITGNDIIEYMKVLFSAMSHFYPEVPKRTHHLTHGVIKLSGGRKMSSREGNVLMASDIIESAVAANKKMSDKDDYRVSIGAIKYSFLKQRLGGDIIYDPAESISLNGNSGPYLQYAHARARSILAKAGGKNEPFNIDKLDEFERPLVAKLSQYVDVVAQAASDYMPHHICSYLHELAQIFNRFYDNSKVIGDTREGLRKELVLRYAETLKTGLGLLGIEAPDSM